LLSSNHGVILQQLGDSRKLLAQFAAQNFAGCRFWDAVHKVNLSGLLVMREAICHKRTEFLLQLGVFCESFAQSDEGDWDFTSLIAWASHDPALFYGWMLEQNRFDLRGSYGETLELDHLLAAVHDAIEAFAVASDDVTGPIPAVAQNGGRGGGLSPISQHELRPA